MSARGVCISRHSHGGEKAKWLERAQLRLALFLPSPIEDAPGVSLAESLKQFARVNANSSVSARFS